MYIFKNAFTNIVRNKGRNILMGVIILVIASACAVTLSIRNSASKIVDSYADKYEITGTISINRQNMMGNFKPGSENQEENISKFNSIESLTIDDIVKYGTSDYVKSYYYTYSLNMNSSNLTKATSTSNNQDKMMQHGENNETSGDFKVVGYSSYESMSDFINGTYTITEGSVSEDFNANNCVINSELATLNNISVGDTITLKNPNDETKTYELKVTGIYTESEDSSSDNGMSMFSNSVNTIITNNNFVSTIAKDDTTIKTNINPTFVLNSKDVIEKYEAELTKKGLSENYQFTTNLDQISSETEAVKNVSTFATTFLIVTLIIGAIVLFVINMINVRERKYEIGVLRTIGMKKSLVTLQFMTELLIVSIVALLIGSGIGSLMSVPTANSLLKQEVSAATEQSNQIGQNFGRPDDGTSKQDSSTSSNSDNSSSTTDKTSKPSNSNFKGMNGVTKINYVSSIDAVVDIKVLAQLLGIGICLTLVSSLASMISIARFSPITILKERS